MDVDSGRGTCDESPSGSKDPSLNGDGDKPGQSTKYRCCFGKSRSVISQTVDAGCFFRDGQRSIDIVLAYESAPGTPKTPPNDGEAMEETLDEKSKYRQAFEQLLLTCGLELEYESPAESFDGKTGFVKIHAPWHFLASRAELLETRMPTGVNDMPPEQDLFSRILPGSLPNPFILHEETASPEPDYFLHKFERRYLPMFLLTEKTKEMFFTPAQRIRLVDYVLQRLRVEALSEGDRKKWTRLVGNLQLGGLLKKKTKVANVLEALESVQPAKLTVDFDWLLENRIYTAAFPLHDCSLDVSAANTPSDNSTIAKRRWLLNCWASFAYFFKYQPLNHVRAYLGEKNALYYAWVGHYNSLLVIPALLSIFCIIFGTASYSSNETVQEICARNDTICRSCASVHCPFEQLHSFCSYAKLSYIFDNEATIVFAGVMSVWCILLQILWTRRESELANIWGTDVDEKLDYAYRPQFLRKVKEKRFNPVTKTEEPFLSCCRRSKQHLVSFATAMFFIALSIACISAVVIYRTMLQLILIESGKLKVAFVQENLQVFALIVTSIINSLAIVMLRSVYRKVAWWLTEQECPKTQRQFEASFTYKVVSFQFVNYFGSLFYAAFFKGRFFTPHDMPRYLRFCPPDGCLAEVCIQLIVLMTILPVERHLIENLLVPCFRWAWSKIVKKLRSIFTKKNSESATIKPQKRWELDYVLDQPTYSHYMDEYLELILQYAMLTMFAAAFPLGAMLAFFNNLFELRNDARKYLTNYRRPVPVHDRDLGPWINVLKAITTFAVITNGLIITFTSDTIDRYVYEYQLAHNTTTLGYLDYVFVHFKCDDYPKSFGPEICYQEISESTWNDRNLSDPGFKFSENAGVLLRKVDTCLFRDYRYDFNDTRIGHNGIKKYYTNRSGWLIYCAKLLFFLVFERVLFLIQALIDHAIKKVPRHVRLRRIKEEQLKNQAIAHQHKAAKLDTQKTVVTSATATTVETTKGKFSHWNLLRRRELSNLRSVLQMAEAMNAKTESASTESPLTE